MAGEVDELAVAGGVDEGVTIEVVLGIAVVIGAVVVVCVVVVTGDTASEQLYREPLDWSKSRISSPAMPSCDISPTLLAGSK